jgi:hypothetical protein
MKHKPSRSAMGGDSGSRAGPAGTEDAKVIQGIKEGSESTVRTDRADVEV